MSSEAYEYDEARKLALKDFNNKTSTGRYPYLQVLQEILTYTEIVSEVNLGLVDVPLDQVVGTRTEGRTNAFASNFMPLLPEGSEFAAKWKRLYESQLEEGIRDPVKAYEFMNRFYVEEGNKRVSVMKYCDAVTIPAYVTRLVPKPDDSEESIIYYEFLHFYEKTGINYINFSQPGNYAKLMELVGTTPDHEWTDQEKMQFRSAYIRFTNAFQKKGGSKFSLTAGDAFLVYLSVYGFEELHDKMYPEIQQEIGKIWNDFALYPQKPEVKLIMNVGDAIEKKTLAKRLLPQNTAPLKVAFIHTKTAGTSSWTYGHELGRGHLEEELGDRVKTTSYFEADTPEDEIRCFDQAIEDGNTVIFSTSPKLLSTSIKYAMKYPKLKITNCSLYTSCKHLRTYYGRLYEAKFLMGAIAGIMSETEEIGYIADYPIYGMIANINAFAMGAKMVRPEAKIYLKWSKLRPDIPQPHAEHQDVGFISGRDFIIPDEENSPFGLYDANGSEFAMSVWNWGVFYEKMVRSILNGTWDQQLPKDPNSSINYWWGMSSGMIDIICSKRLPAETVHLIELLKKAICVGELHPFSGTIYAQDKTEHRHMSAEDIITMDWLADHIVGSIPIMDELLDDAKPIVQLQGVERAKGTDGGVST